MPRFWFVIKVFKSRRNLRPGTVRRVRGIRYVVTEIAETGVPCESDGIFPRTQFCSAGSASWPPIDRDRASALFAQCSQGGSHHKFVGVKRRGRRGEYNIYQAIVRKATHLQHWEKTDHIACLFGNKPATAWFALEKPKSTQMHLQSMAGGQPEFAYLLHMSF